MSLFEVVYGPRHPLGAAAVTNLGIVLIELGKLAEARAAQERALAIFEAVYGPHHPYVAITLSNLGDVLGDLGELAEAQAAQERARAIEEAAGPAAS